MAGIGSVVVQFLADDKMSKTVGKITRAVQGLNKDLGDSDSKSSKFGKALAGAAVGVGTALAVAGGAMVEFAKAAAEDNAQANNLANTLKSIPGITKKMIDANSEWIDSMEIATNVSDTDLRKAISQLALATGDLTRAQELTALALDISAGSGKSLDSVTRALSKAVAGNTTALERAFPWLDKNKDGAVDLDEALTGLEGAYKGASKAAADQKPWERLNTVWGQIQEKLGEKLLPYLEDLSEWLANPKNQKKLDEWITDIGDMADVMGTLAANIGRVGSAFGRLFDPLEQAWNALPAWLRNWIKNGMPIVPGYGNVNNLPRSGSGQYRTAGPSARSLSAGPAPAAPPVFVTEEQVARAVGSLLLRSQARNGRIVLVS